MLSFRGSGQGGPDGSNLALLGGYADPFQTVFKSTQVAITSPVKPISTPIDQIRNENGVAVAAYLILGYTWKETFSSTEIIYMIGGSNNNSTDSMSGNSSPQPPPLKPGCTGPALWSGVQAGASDLFVPQGADPSGDIEGLVQDENAQRAVAGGLYVVANSARYLAPAADVAADFIPVVGEVLLAYQVGHALYKDGEAYKESIDQCYSAP